MNTQKFVGPKKVDHVVIDEVKTFGQNDVVVVHYEGGTTELMPKKTFELIATDEPSDYTTVRNLKFVELRKTLYPIIGEYVSVLGEEQSVRDAQKTVTLQKVLSAISEVDMKDEEMDPFFTQVDVEFRGITNAILYELSNFSGRAINFLWTGNDSLFVPGANPMSSTTFLEAKKISSKITNAEPKATAE